MVDSQLRPNSVTEPLVVTAFETVPREDYVPAERASLAYSDEEIEVAPGRYLVAPLTLGRLVSEAHIRPGQNVLIVGGTTGYSAAIISHLGAHVTVLEEEALAAAFTPGPGVNVVHGPLIEGAASFAPFDLILIEGMIETLPETLLAQVVEGGRISAILVDEGVPRAGIGRVFGGHVGWSFFMDLEAPALPGFAKAREFVF
nr:protein-L-isoaspartate O-methyltransferase [Pacificimonas pallii]